MFLSNKQSLIVVNAKKIISTQKKTSRQNSAPNKSVNEVLWYMPYMSYSCATSPGKVWV